MAIDESPVTPLDEDSCWGLLSSLEVGRLATSENDSPEIFPVNYVVDGPSVIFRTAEGSKLSELIVNNNVAFEVDTWTLQGGSSVVIKGTAEEILAADELARAKASPLRPWVPTVKTHFVRITPTSIDGRTFRFGPEK